jgi:adenylosuccinate lyase
MELSALSAISPLDGRYSSQLKELNPIFSEYALIRYRLFVELQWLRFLAEVPLEGMQKLSSKALNTLDEIYKKFDLQEAEKIKLLESRTNHDVKALEYYIKDQIASCSELSNIQEFIHFACTSEDINNLAYALMIKDYRASVLLPLLNQLSALLAERAHEYADIAMLARTHGQAATPTTLGKEFAIFAHRLKRKIEQLSQAAILGKLNGATGNFNAHIVAYPQLDWLKLSQTFVESLGLSYNKYSTQIESHDYLAEIFHLCSQTHTLLIGFCRDVWAYISLHYLIQKPVEQEVGSSTMPHKINPIDFENAEGNFGLANALLDHMANKLPISRWQRDLSDSTVLRNMGSAFAYAVLAYRALLRGLRKISPNHTQISEDLAQHWDVLAEAIQTVMRRYGCEEPYEKLKEFTRGRSIDQKGLINFIDSQELPEKVKAELKQLRPENYIGLAAKLAKNFD